MGRKPWKKSGRGRYGTWAVKTGSGISKRVGSGREKQNSNLTTLSKTLGTQNII